MAAFLLLPAVVTVTPARAETLAASEAREKCSGPGLNRH